MKIFNFVFQIFFLIVLVGFLIYFLTGYDSAFEADQSCHSYLANYSKETGDFECDHDTETHKWILYENQENSKPAKIIKKFRYKFL
tara:strand:- start:53 stop:310 length:258 start_codon:yes stop_codon:yes gene_type:complete